MIQQERLIEEFTELVGVDSETKEERNIADLLLKKLTGLGLEAYEDDSASATGHGAGNLIAIMKGNKKEADPIYFTCHMDTVTPGKGIRVQRKGGYLSSDGTTILGADDKAGLAALLEALRVVKENGLPHGDIQIIITAGEESGLVGAKALDPAKIRAKYGFALDSEGKVGTIVVAAPSQAKIRTIIYGKSAHAGVAPEKGVSAIQIAAKAIAKMPLGRIDEETTANIGRFEGGRATNIVCDRVDIWAEARSLDKEKLEKQLKTMKEIFEKTAEEMGGRAEVRTEISYPAFAFCEEDPVVQIAKEAAEKVGREAVLAKSGGGSDANIFAGFGIPTVVLGVGYEEIHTTHERIPVGELVKLSEMVLAIIETAANRK